MSRDAYEQQIIANHEVRRKKREEKRKRRKEGLLFMLIGMALFAVGITLTMCTDLDPYANMVWVVFGSAIFIGGLFDVA